MVVDMYIIGPKQDRVKLVFFGLFDFFKMKRPRPRLQETKKWSFLVLVLFGLSPVQLQSFASPRTGLSNTKHALQWEFQNFHQKFATFVNQCLPVYLDCNPNSWVNISFPETFQICFAKIN